MTALGALLGASLVGALASCERSEPMSAPPRPPAVASGFVVGDAAHALDANGRFTAAALSASDEQGLISSQRAADLAAAYIRTFGANFQGAWESERGGPLDLASLRVDRVYFASTPYGAVPDNVHPGFRNGLGPYYIVILTSGGRPALGLAVAARNTQVQIDQAGLVVLPRSHGNDFWGQAVALDPSRGYHPISPEEAVSIVGTATGAKTAAVPELQLRSYREAPIGATWKLRLDRSIGGNAASALGPTTEVFLGGEDNDVQQAHVIQPTHETVPVVLVQTDGKIIGPANIDMPIRPQHELNLVRSSLPGRP